MLKRGKGKKYSSPAGKTPQIYGKYANVQVLNIDQLDLTYSQPTDSTGSKCHDLAPCNVCYNTDRQKEANIYPGLPLGSLDIRANITNKPVWLNICKQCHNL